MRRLIAWLLLVSVFGLSLLLVERLFAREKAALALSPVELTVRRGEVGLGREQERDARAASPDRREGIRAVAHGTGGAGEARSAPLPQPCLAGEDYSDDEAGDCDDGGDGDSTDEDRSTDDD
jgi:hypothetical protein